MSNRFVHLECARGIAAIIVILHHFCLAFYPALKWSVKDGGLESTPLYVLVNGDGAVLFFFALSGFVLTRSMFKKPSWQKLTAATIKRLPRLFVPVSVSIFMGYLVLMHCPGPHLAAAAISHSSWLQNFADAGIPTGLMPSLGDALRQCFFVFFRRRDYYYNSNLWTMFVEFWGSMIVFFIVALYCIPGSRKPGAVVALHVALLAVCYAKATSLVPFIGGSLLAYVNTVLWPEIKIPRVLVYVLLICAGTGFSISARPFETGAALIVMFVLIYDPALKTLMSGRIAAFLGQISFPIYLVSTLVILSISSSVFVWLSEHAFAGASLGSISLLVTLFLSLVTCLPLMLIDRVWLLCLNTIFAAGGNPYAEASGIGGSEVPAAMQGLSELKVGLSTDRDRR